MLKASLASDVLKGATTISISPEGAMSNFDVSGGDAYIEKDKFSYTGISGTSLTGCTGISFSHSAGEVVYTHYGIQLRDIVPPILLYEKNDPDGVIDTIVECFDTQVGKTLKDTILEIHKNIDPTRADEDYLRYICSNVGVEFSDDASEGLKRSLARQAAQLLKKRGTIAAFQFIVWHILEYRVFVDVETFKIPARMNDSQYRMLKPATPLGISDKTGSYWKFEEYTGPGPYYIPNEIDSGSSLELDALAMYTGTGSSMFPKMTALTVNGVNTFARAPGDAHFSTNLHGKEQFSIEWFMKPASAGSYPQKVIAKGTLIQIERPNATDLEISMTDASGTTTETVTDCITENENHYVAVLFDKPSLYVVVNDSIELMKTNFDIEMLDSGADWVIGDVSGANPYEGRIDTIRLEIGKRYPLNCLDYYEHIKILKTYGEDPDRNAYMLGNAAADYKVYVTIDNGDGDQAKINTLKQLIEEWLTIGPYEVIDTAHLPLEIETGFWKGIIDGQYSRLL